MVTATSPSWWRWCTPRRALSRRGPRTTARAVSRFYGTSRNIQIANFVTASTLPSTRSRTRKAPGARRHTHARQLPHCTLFLPSLKLGQHTHAHTRTFTHTTHTGSYAELCADPAAAAWVLGQLGATAKTDRLKGFERIAAVSLCAILCAVCAKCVHAALCCQR